MAVSSSAWSPLAGYLGGKYHLSSRIIPLIPPHRCYVEVFAGAAWVFFRKPPSPTEVINDVNDELINVYRQIQSPRGLARLERHAAWALHSRSEFNRFKHMSPQTIEAMPPADRAWRWLYLLKTSFGGKYCDYSLAPNVPRGTSDNAPDNDPDNTPDNLADSAAAKAPDNAAQGGKSGKPNPATASGSEPGRPRICCNSKKTFGYKKGGRTCNGMASLAPNVPRGTLPRATVPGSEPGRQRIFPRAKIAFGYSKGGRPWTGMACLAPDVPRGTLPRGGVLPGGYKAAGAGGRGNLLRLAHERLRRCIVESLDWAECLARYDSPHAFFYLDPPYVGHEDDYGKGLFARAEFGRMAQALANLQGKFILSINDCEEARAIFAPFIINKVSTNYSIANKLNKKQGELLVSNYEPGL